MEYPIYISGERAGTLAVRQDGLYTAFEARLPANEGEFTRLWVCGTDGSGCLGIMEPREGELYLRRRLSRMDMRAFPKKIEYASTQPAALPDYETGEAVKPGCEKEERTPEAGAEAGGLAALEGVEKEAEYIVPGDEGGETEDTSYGLLWFSRPDGSLTAFDGVSSLIALPARLRSDAPGARLWEINGREYMVFRS